MSKPSASPVSFQDNPGIRSDVFWGVVLLVIVLYFVLNTVSTAYWAKLQKRHGLTAGPTSCMVLGWLGVPGIQLVNPIWYAVKQK